MVVREIEWSGREDREGSCEHGNDLSVSIKCWGIVEEVHNWRHDTHSSAP
jgi:hypothetical protein